MLYLLSTSCVLTLASSTLFCSPWIHSTAAQFPATWRTTSRTSWTSRRSSPSRHPCGALLRREFCICFTLPLYQIFCHYCNNKFVLALYYSFIRDMCCDILIILLYICVTWSWSIYDCSVYVLYKSGVTTSYLNSQPFKGKVGESSSFLASTPT